MAIHAIRNWLTIGVDPRRILSIRYLPRYFAQWHYYKSLAEHDEMHWYNSFPCLVDWTAKTPFDPHYFYQSAWMSRKLSNAAPMVHVDIGSSVLMIGVISAFVPTLFLDYRPLYTSIKGLTSLGGDILHLPFASNTIQSLSCLHVIEHIGLGRYGDPLDPDGSKKAARELVRVLAQNGRLYLSTPVGCERLQFNAHRVFAPESIVSMFDGLELVDFAIVDDNYTFYDHPTLDGFTDSTYACGMFEFTKSHQLS